MLSIANTAQPGVIDPADEAAIRNLHATYWSRTDGRTNAPPEDLFCDDAVFVLGNLTLSGREKIVDFFRRRQSTQQENGRTTRHLSAELMLRPLSAGQVITTSTVIAMAGSGPFPIAASPPSVADFEDLCVRQANGRWLFQRRVAVSIFAGPEAPRFARSAATTSPIEEKVDER